MPEITTKQREALVSLSERAASPFDFGSTTVNVLCKRGLAERVRHETSGRMSTTLHITPQGLAAIGR